MPLMAQKPTIANWLCVVFFSLLLYIHTNECIYILMKCSAFVTSWYE